MSVDELSYDKAAAVMKCKVGTIKSRVSRARLRLIELLEYTSDALALDDTTKAVIDRSSNASTC